MEYTQQIINMMANFNKGYIDLLDSFIKNNEAEVTREETKDEKFEIGHIFKMPRTCIWINPINEITGCYTGSSKVIGDRYGINNCECQLIGEYEDKFLLRYLTNPENSGGGTCAENKTIFLLKKDEVISWADELDREKNGEMKIREIIAKSKEIL